MATWYYFHLTNKYSPMIELIFKGARHLETGLSSRAKINITKFGDMLYLEATSRDNRNISPELQALINSRKCVTFQDLFDFFDFGCVIDPAHLAKIMKELS